MLSIKSLPTPQNHTKICVEIFAQRTRYAQRPSDSSRLPHHPARLSPQAGQTRPTLQRRLLEGRGKHRLLRSLSAASLYVGREFEALARRRGVLPRGGRGHHVSGRTSLVVRKKDRAGRRRDARLGLSLRISLQQLCGLCDHHASRWGRRLCLLRLSHGLLGSDFKLHCGERARGRGGAGRERPKAGSGRRP